MSEDLEQRKKTLLDLRIEVTQRMESIKREIHELNADKVIEDIEVAEQSVRLRMLRSDSSRAILRLKEIQHALQLVDEGEYGWCESCGIEIDIERLKTRPESTMCIDCQTHAERNQQIFAGASGV
ncbi:TraR/DksA family transcriptional regulator [Vibrio mediterranei]|uniref:TraR/DksA family transcriptional regulator n=1 Tax=Vibrio mediterranei TaxID=689 RepID=UPI004067ADAE